MLSYYRTMQWHENHDQDEAAAVSSGKKLFWKQNFWYLEVTFLMLKLLIFVSVPLWSWLSAFSIIAYSVQ